MLADFEEVSVLLQKLKALCNVHGQMSVPKREHFRHFAVCRKCLFSHFYPNGQLRAFYDISLGSM